MFVRIGTFRIRPGTLDALRQRYYAERAPLVKATKGNVDCVVLEPVDEDEQAPVAVCTVWQTEADAAAYEADAQPLASSRSTRARSPWLALGDSSTNMRGSHVAASFPGTQKPGVGR
jgi:heme-degrading monooxygenase HmoA